MNYEQGIKLVDFLNKRFRQAGVKPLYCWAIDKSWDKYLRIARMLGYERNVTHTTTNRSN